MPTPAGGAGALALRGRGCSHHARTPRSDLPPALGHIPVTLALLQWGWVEASLGFVGHCLKQTDRQNTQNKTKKQKTSPPLELSPPPGVLLLIFVLLAVQCPMHAPLSRIPSPGRLAGLSMPDAQKCCTSTCGGSESHHVVQSVKSCTRIKRRTVKTQLSGRAA